MRYTAVPVYDLAEVEVDVGKAWDVCCKKTYPLTTGDQIKEMILRGEVLLWAVIDLENSVVEALAFTLVEDHPNCRVLNTAGLVGERMDNWYPALHQALVAHALRMGCSRAEVHVRTGLIKKLERLGWEVTSTVMGLSLDGQQDKEHDSCTAGSVGPGDDALPHESRRKDPSAG